MPPNINNPGGVKNDPDEIRDAVVSDATRFPGGFIDQQITEAGAAVQILGQFQVTNASVVDRFNVSAQDNGSQGLAFKPDGSQLYVVGSELARAYQYSLSTAYDISTASFSQSFDVSAKDANPSGLAFKPDGSQLYVAGRVNDRVFQYGLSTAYDISTASFSQSFDASTQDTRTEDVAFNSDGSQLYVVGSVNASVFQYSLSTAYDISTASFSQSFDVSTQDGVPQGLAFKPDGSQLYVVGKTNDSVFQYSLSTAYDISTASFSQSFDVSTQDNDPRGLTFKPDGSQLYVVGENNATVYQYAVGVIGAQLG